MSYPTFIETTESIPIFANVHNYFNVNHPSEWTLEKFAQDRETYDLDVFEDGLKTIMKAGRGCYHAFAARCYNWLANNPDHVLIQAAKDILKTKLLKFRTSRVNVQFREETEQDDLQRLQKFTESGRRSLQNRFSSFESKWTLQSGTVVEDVLFEAGKKLTVYHSVHSFIIDVQDSYTKKLFNDRDWNEIRSNIPQPAPYTPSAKDYLRVFAGVETTEELRRLLEIRPDENEMELVHICLVNWLGLYETNSPSPFVIESSLSEAWWMTHAWGVCNYLSKGIEGHFIITGEKAGVDSSSRRNHKDRLNNPTPAAGRKRIGTKADLIWRSMSNPEKDWAMAEAALVWDESATKYSYESNFKLPRQLHDVLTARTVEVGGVDNMRSVLVSGLIIGGSSVQRVALCWGNQGSSVTRLIKWKRSKIDSSIKNMVESLIALHQILLFRSSTIHFVRTYEQAYKSYIQKRIEEIDSHDGLANEANEADGWYNILHSTP
ncbi:hypothetical protein BGZ65_011657 [Modicella reniformis]|uniref:Uncharacterized protein n=1 Tax=Modicella reniformis TaxID=1440133 RepID=A0A9P6MJL9_9FUNG|nr:hypothetical protein BGZ65_011657 [Modicella reniformis]